MKIFTVILSLFLLIPTAFAEAEPKHAKFRTTFEEITLPQNEKMGLQGFTLLFGVNDYLFVGPAAYGAITGQRGGFITLGLALDVDIKLTGAATLNSGLFVGGGGGRGGYTIQGGGLQVRSHIAGQYQLDKYGKLGLGISYQDFPNGSIHSLQPFLAYDYNFDALMMDGWHPLENHASEDENSGADTEFSVVYRRYHVPDGVLNDRLQPQFPTVDILGVQWSRFLSEHVFFKAETEGALGGDSHGYMQIMFGGGYALNLTQSTRLKFAAAAGVAGGGELSTAGGLLLNADVSLQQRLTDSLFAEAGMGYVVAPDGDFKASSVTLSAGSYFNMPTTLASLGAYNQHNLRIRFVHQTYTANDPKWRNHHADLNVQLIGFQNDYFVRDYLYLTGQGIAAYAGQGGNYMTGLVGAGLHHQWGTAALYTDWEVLVGAAGGGGLDVGGGLVWQSNIDLGYKLSDAGRIAISYGQMQAPKGNFKAHVFGASVSYDLSLFAR